MGLRALSLVGRITAASALAAALGGAASALFAGVAAREFGGAHESQGVRRAARQLSEELAEELSGDDDDDDDDDDQDEERITGVAGLLQHELEDVKLEGAHAALWLEGGFSAGDRALPRLAPNECRKLKLGGRSLRACSMAVGKAGLVTLAAGTEGERARAALLVRALLLGTVAGALLGGLLSYLLARWAIAPLTALRDRVRAVRVEEPLPELVGAAVSQPEVEELRSAVADLVERLGAALVHAQAFAAEAAHELRTPLTTIAGELELLAEDAASTDIEALMRVRTQVAELTQLVERLLVLAQPARLSRELSELVDLGDVLDAVLSGLPSVSRGRVSATCPDDLLVRGDAALLRALVSNALENALKFSEGPVTLSVAAHGHEAWIDVLDEGPGLSAEERERVFAPFYRTKGARAQGTQGHGLGLALIRQVAFRHRGSAAFLERPRGAHLRICLPRADA